MKPIIEVTHLSVRFAGRGFRAPAVRAVDDVSFTVLPGETVGLVGESGSGKSTIGRAILGLVPAADGELCFDGEDITRASGARRRELAKDLQVVFQDPYSSLNPRRTIEDSLVEPLRVQSNVPSAEAKTILRNLLATVRLPSDAGSRLPRDFSGGQRQRIAIARALATDPRVVICDEAVSALDLSTQAQVINLLESLQAERQLAYLFISHDLATVKHLCRRIVVLYNGRIMESGDATDVTERPLHPYTRALLASAPVSDPTRQRARRTERAAASVSNTPPLSRNMAAQCPFAARCPLASDVCWTTRPKAIEVDATTVECHLYDPASGHPEAATTLAALAS